MKSFSLYLFSLLLLLFSVPALAQIGIGTTSPAASAALEVSSTSNNKGILIPRLSASQKDAITSPAEGLMVYQTTAPVGFYYYAGTGWKLMVTQTDLDTKVNKATGKELSTNDYTSAEKTKLADIAGTNTGDQTTISGNAGTATKLATARDINGVAFDGTANITVTADAGTLTGTTLKSTVIGSSLTSVGTLANLTVTNPIAGSVTGNAATATNLTGLSTPIATLNNLTGTNTGDQTSVSGNAGTATKLATARDVNGVAFDGTANITVTADAGTLTGTTLKSTVTGSSLTSVGTLTNLTVTNPIAGSITGNAATATIASTVTTNANLTGDVTSIGNATIIADGAVTNAKITDVVATKITGTLAVGNGGTGAATLTGLVKGNGTGAMTAAVSGTDYLQAVAPGTSGNVLTSNGSTWVSNKSGSNSIICKIADAPNTILSIGGYEFRYNSTTGGGYIEVRAVSGYDNMMVFCQKNTSSWILLGPSTTQNYHRTNTSVNSGWLPVISLATGSTWDNRVTLSTYESFEATMFSMGNGSAIPNPLKSYKIFAAIDGYNQVFLKAEYTIK